jgi:N-acetylglutamate synthase-like GNAT family acetyltransferase
MRIRDFSEDDIEALIEIMNLNDQYKHPEVDGPEAMIRVSKNPSAVFRVVEMNNKVVGFIRGVYDGSRAIIHQMSVHPEWQNRKIGLIMVKHVARLFWEMGAPTVSVTAIKKEDMDSTGFFEKLGFKELPVAFMVHFDINRLLRT